LPKPDTCTIGGAAPVISSGNRAALCMLSPFYLHEWVPTQVGDACHLPAVATDHHA
jgi:hypothetical protein